MSTESVKPKTEPRTCDVCAQEEDSHAEFSWQLAREDVEVAGDDDILVLLESRLAGPTVIVLPEAGGVVVYSVIRCCDGCLNESFRRYEDSHNPRPKKTRRALLDDIKGVSQEKGWLLYALQLDHLAPRGFPNVALIRDEQLRLIFARPEAWVRQRPVAIPSGQVFISPGVPPDIQAGILTALDERRTTDDVAFLYMDEKYPDSARTA